MALVDPYAPCHCGSGQKYKWCCQSVEPYIERSQRLLDNGQIELAINPLVEGLAKAPDNVSLLLRKALIQLHLNQTEPAGETLRHLLQINPGPSRRFDLDDEAGSGHRGCPGGRGPVSAGFLTPPGRKIALSSRRWPRSSARAWAARATRRRRSSIFELAVRLSSDEEKQVSSHLQNLRANPPFALGEESLSPFAGA